MSTTITTVNPYTGKDIKTYNLHTKEEIDTVLKTGEKTFKTWKKTAIKERTSLLKKLAKQLENKREDLSALMTAEMGKPIAQSRAEIDKCIWLCDFYAKNADNFLSDAIIDTEAQESFISYDPIGGVLAVMPWNYPFWQVFRFAVPTITAGNVGVLKHAANVTGCALAIQDIFEAAGYPKGCFQTIIADHKATENVLESNFIQAVSVTGSEKAGKSIASIAGKNLKKSVLELGGNNACIVWDNADLETYIPTMVKARFQNTGQSCIAAKRFIVEENIYDEFLEKFKKEVESLKVGNPEEEDTFMASMARTDLAEELKKQVDESVKKGAKVLMGNTLTNANYAPTILTNITEDMPVFSQETFGPVATIITAKNKKHSLELAANSRFGLGAMLFTEDIDAAREAIDHIEDGAFFVNEMVKSDPRLPFGGTKASGYGRELSKEGMLEFVNKKTVYIK